MTAAADTLAIITYPDPRLRTRARDLANVTDEVRAVADRMIGLMFEAEGIGLAAPQVGLPWRLFVAHVPAAEGRATDSDPPTATATPRVFINPVVSDPEGPVEPAEEGCLSLPDIRGDVLRPRVITVRALDARGHPFTFRVGGLLARCVQHEIDHLDGVLIIDRMTQMGRLRSRAALRAMERDAAKADDPPSRPAHGPAGAGRAGPRRSRRERRP